MPVPAERPASLPPVERRLRCSCESLMSLQINGRRSVFDMNDTNAEEEGEEVLEALGRRLKVSGWALAKMLKLSLIHISEPTRPY